MNNLLSKIRELSFKDNQENFIPLAYPIPQKNNPWGVLSFLKNTYYKRFFKIVDEELINQALFGRPIPLLNQLGRNPKEYFRSMKDDEKFCASLLNKSCPSANTVECVLTGRAPLCYESPLIQTFPEHKDLLYYVTSAWNDGRHIVLLKEN